MGRQIFWWLTKLGVLGIPVESCLGRRLKGRETTAAAFATVAVSRINPGCTYTAS
jgi:hypothetical protein